MAEERWVRVGRWLSEKEWETMRDTGYVAESASGTTHVAMPANPEAYRRQAMPGSVYVEFDVPAGALKPTQPGWAKILGPRSLEGRLAARQGKPIPQIPECRNLEKLEIKV